MASCFERFGSFLLTFLLTKTFRDLRWTKPIYWLSRYKKLTIRLVLLYPFALDCDVMRTSALSAPLGSPAYS